MRERNSELNYREEADLPLYEYHCRTCARDFEMLVRESTEPECPACHGRDLERALSTFAVSTATPRASAPVGACGACGDPRGPGACSMN